MQKNENNFRIEMRELRQLKGSEVTSLREEILQEQKGLCAWCKDPITEETGYSLDHQHKLKSEEPGPDGKGLVRGVLCRACNVLEGKIWNNMTRFKQPKNVQDRVDLLKQLIMYYENGTYPIIHHTEKAKEPTLSKRNYNKLKREYTGKKKLPEYPKSGKLTVGLQAIFEEYGIEPYN